MAKRKTLRPLRMRPHYFDAIEREINNYFYKVFYAPIIKEFKKNKVSAELENGRNDLLEAIRNGTIEFNTGVFSGSFNSKTSRALKKIGAVYYKKTNTWSLPYIAPSDIQLAAYYAESRYNNLFHSLMAVLDNAAIAPLTDFSSPFYKTIGAIDNDFISIARQIAIVPKITPTAKKIIARDWSKNLNLYIKKWTDENVLELRQRVTQNTLAGNRAKGLENIIQQNYGVSKRKAKFLARQETSLLMSKLRETRFADLGITDYIWHGSLDERERPDHKALEGKQFSFAHPPITNRQTGARNNPGEDFNCRCVALPVIE